MCLSITAQRIWCGKGKAAVSEGGLDILLLGHFITLLGQMLAYKNAENKIEIAYFPYEKKINMAWFITKTPKTHNIQYIRKYKTILYAVQQKQKTTLKKNTGACRRHINFVHGH